jgi:predicted small lipoprotein YifL
MRRSPMIKSLLLAAVAAFVLSACGDDASKKGPGTTPTPPPAEKKAEPKK